MCWDLYCVRFGLFSSSVKHFWLILTQQLELILKCKIFFQDCVTLTVGEDFCWGSLWFGLCIWALMTRQSLWIKLCWTKCPCQIVHECNANKMSFLLWGLNSFACLLYHFFTIYQRKMVIFPQIWLFDTEWILYNTLYLWNKALILCQTYDL